jgi:hypothetical protein
MDLYYWISWFNFLFGLVCFGLGAFLMVWFGMNFVGAVTVPGHAKVGFLTLLGTVCSAAMAWGGIIITSGAYQALFPV